MKKETIIRLTNSHEAIDFQAPGAAMRLAWYWVAQELWSRRVFDLDRKGTMILLGIKLQEAHRHVNQTRAYQARVARAEEKFGPELARLRQERRDLDMKPFGVRIEPLQREIDQRVRDLIATA